MPLPALPTEAPSGVVVDIGGTKILVAIVRHGIIARKRSLRISQFAGPADMMDTIGATARQLCGAPGLTPDMSAESVVVAVPGRLDRESGTVLRAANLPLVDFPLAAELSSRLDGAVVRIEHDAVCGLLGETTAGAARGCSNVIYLTVSTGISVGILVDGALLKGAHGAAGEVGHTPVEWPGIPCTCGSSGCLEAYASGWALAELGRQAAASGTSPALATALAAGGAVTARDVLSAARRGDQASAAIAGHAIELLTRAIELLFVTLDPELVVLGGGVMSNSYFADRLLGGRLRDGQHGRTCAAQLGARSVLHGGILFLGHQGRGQPSVSNGSTVDAVTS